MRLFKLTKRKLWFLAALIVPASNLWFLVPKAAAAPYNSAYLISNTLFTDYGSMGVRGIQDFLSAQGSYLATYHDTEVCSNNYMKAHYGSCGKKVLASQLIYDAANAYGLSPRTIMATMQKEESLITDPSPDASQIDFAMGYACPDSGGCGSVSGFFNQLDWGTWQLRLNYARASGDNTWLGTDGDPSNYPYACPSATRYYSTGLYPGNDVTFYDDSHTAYTHFVIANAATASLYCYTPHAYPGSRNQYYSGSYWFVYYFSQWWGSTTSPCYNDSPVAGKRTGKELFVNKYSAKTADTLTYTQLNNTGSNCTEIHVMDNNLHGWQAHIVTQLPDVDPAAKFIGAADTDSNHQDELFYYDLVGNNVALYQWNSGYKSWKQKLVTNLGSFTSSQGEIISGDMNGDGKDELMFIKYSGDGGRVEVHTWAPDYQQWSSSALTSLSGFDPTQGQIITGDMNGDGKDELLYINYNGSNGRVEVHTWAPGYHAWAGHALTMLGTITPSIGTFVTGNLNGTGRDYLMYLKYTGTNDQVEVHTMATGYHSWASHALTPLSNYSPTD